MISVNDPQIMNLKNREVTFSDRGKKIRRYLFEKDL